MIKMNPIIQDLKRSVRDVYDLFRGKTIRKCDEAAADLERTLNAEEGEAKKFYQSLKEVNRIADKYLH